MPEELTTRRDDDEAFAALLKQAATPPALLHLPPGLSERIAAATYARPTLWQQLVLVLRPAPARFALGGALTAAALCVVIVPRLSKPIAPSAAPSGEKQTVIVPEKSTSFTPLPTITPTPSPERTLPKSSLRVAEAKNTTTPVKAVSNVLDTKSLASTTPSVAPRASVLKDHALVAVKTSESVETPSVSSSSTLPEPATQAGTTAVATRASSEGESAGLSAPQPTLTSPSTQAQRLPRTEVALASGGDEDGTNNRVRLSVTDDQMKAAHGGFKSLRNNDSTAYRPGTQVSLSTIPVQ